MKPQSHPRQQCALKFFLRSDDQAVALTLFKEGELTVYIRSPKPEMGVMRFPSLPALLDNAAGQRPWLIEALPCPKKAQAEIVNPTIVGLALEVGQPFAVFVPRILTFETVMEIFAAFPFAEIIGGRNGLHLKEEEDYIVTVDARNPSTPAIGSETDGGMP